MRPYAHMVLSKFFFLFAYFPGGNATELSDEAQKMKKVRIPPGMVKLIYPYAFNSKRSGG